MYTSDIISALVGPCLLFAGGIKLIGATSGRGIQRGLDKIYQWSVRWDLQLDLSKFRRLMEGEANPACHMGPTSHQAVMKQTQQAANLGILVNADSKPSMKCPQAVKDTMRALRELGRLVGSGMPEVILPLFTAFVRPHLEYCVRR